MEEFDCVVVGAGLYGLAAARQFLHVHPQRSLVIFDAQSTIGGTWATERLYPGLKTNNLLGTYEYPSFPMSTEDFDVKPAEHIKGSSIHTYLEVYAERHALSGLTRLNHKVVSAEHRDDQEAGGWFLNVLASSNEQHQQVDIKVLARRLIVATGLTSRPMLPHFQGEEAFGGDIWHIKDFAKNTHSLRVASTVTVYGGHKSAWDAVYEYAAAGIKVNWVIRSRGHGPCWMSRPYATPFNLQLEKLSNTRLLTWLSPCVWGSADGYGLIRRFLHGTAIGRFLVDAFWKTVAADVLSGNSYDGNSNTAKLRPWWNAIMFVGDSLSILNYEQDIFKLVRSNMVQVHVGEIAHLTKGAVHLTDGSQLDSDLIIAATGWDRTCGIQFLPEGIETEMVAPLYSTSTVEKCDADILRQFPRLRDQPLRNTEYHRHPVDAPSTVPEDLHMLHRFMVPSSPRSLQQRDLAFAGMLSNTNNAITAHIGGLWIAAFFAEKTSPTRDLFGNNEDTMILNGQNRVKENKEKNIQYEAILHNRWGRWRYPADWGSKRPSFVFDAVPYFDLLLQDLGLENRRKRNWLLEIVAPYGPADYKGIEDEWVQKQRLA